KHLSEFPQEIIALDEVGLSPLSGPVVIGAVRLIVQEPESLKSLIRFLKRKGVKDSKALTSEARVKILSSLGISPREFRQKNIIELKGFSVHFTTWEMDHE